MAARRRTSRTDHLINGAMVITLALFLALLYRGYLLTEQRQYEAALRSLNIGVSEARRELDTFFGSLSDELREMEAYVKGRDTVYTASTFLAELLPEFKTSPSLRAMALADPDGNELLLTSDKGKFMLRQTVGGSRDVLPVVYTLEENFASAFAITDTMNLEEHTDPRSQPWFAHALNDRRGVGRWLGPNSSSTDGANSMVAALPIRSSSLQDRIQVAMIEVDLNEVMNELFIRPPDRRAALFLVTSEQELFRTASSNLLTDSLEELCQHSIEAWIEGKTTAPLPFTHSGEEFLTRIVPYTLNGYDLYLGSVVPAEGAKKGWVAEYWLLAIAGLLMITFTSLFLWSSLRKRHDLRRSLLQEERSRTTHEKLKQALGEREVLDREVHHRVKNNLQIIISLINLQSRTMEDGSALLNEFKRAQRRIGAMAMVHLKLYGLQDLRGVDLQPFVEGLVHEVAKDNGTPPTQVSCTVESNGIKLDVDTSIDLGLIIHELVNNSYEHAFPFATGGHIDVVVSHENGSYLLIVSDNGIGKKRPSPQGRIGLEVVELLAEKLDGTFEMIVNKGTVAKVSFRMNEPTTNVLQA